MTDTPSITFAGRMSRPEAHAIRALVRKHGLQRPKLSCAKTHGGGIVGMVAPVIHFTFTDAASATLFSALCKGAEVVR